jgi:phosphoglycerol transferase MdoB-like AlkP superfamily enzyme
VLLISVESLSASFLGAYGDTRGLTPNLDRLAAQGLRFERLFATGTRTVRGLEALSLGTPPVPGQAIVRRPHNAHLSTVGGLLKQQGFSALFLYGGYGYFDNMSAYFDGNGYRVIDRTDFRSARAEAESVWGVPDEFLYDTTLSALDEASAQGRPFFAHVMTTSNHRPFTYPDGRIDIPSPGGREGAVKYTDWALGRFVEQARTHAWFDDTLFVIVADHCASAAGRTRLPVEGYHIPMLFYAPALLRPGTYARLASQIDVAPTLLDLLGARGEEQFFGRSLFKGAALEPRAFIANYQELGYYAHDTLTVLKPRQQAESFHIDPHTLAATSSALDPELLAEAIAFYETSSHAFDRGTLRSPEAEGTVLTAPP